MNIFGYILIVFTVLLTVFVGIKQPKMHTKLLIYDSQYELVEENQTPQAETISKTEELPTMPVENTQSRIQIIMDEQETPVTQVEVKKVEQPKTAVQTKQTKVQQQKAPVTTSTQQTSKIATTTKPVEKTVSQTKPQTTAQSQVQIQTPKTVEKTLPTQTTVKVLTAQEEEIAWNIWRSNLQNRIMRDSKLPTLPMGTVFKVSFDVDKYGKITNLQTWSTDSKYTPYAIEYIAPTIKSYQGKAILDFPQGSQRAKTSFNGSWKIASTSKYSTPNDYNDTERVVK